MHIYNSIVFMTQMLKEKVPRCLHILLLAIFHVHFPKQKITIAQVTLHFYSVPWSKSYSALFYTKVVLLALRFLGGK